MSNKRYKYYMQKVDNQGNLIDGTKKDLETDFDGLLYSKCDGINAIGKAKNIYVETYAGSSKARVHIPNVIQYEPTQIKLTLFFHGENRQQVMDEFNTYIMEGLHRYWDNGRNKYFDFYIIDKTAPTEEYFKGSIPYINITYTLQNIYGKTFSL